MQLETETMTNPNSKGALRLLANKIQGERDNAIEALRGVEELIAMTDTRGWISHDQRLALLGNIRSAIPENDQVELPPNGGSESKKGVVGG